MVGYKFDRLKILVIDANAHMRKVLKTILQAFGMSTISEAAEGKLAWDEFCQGQPDVIFLDWQMTDMSGLEFTKMVRTSASSPNPFVPIIMVTGYAQASHIARARDAGVTEVLARPIAPKIVMTRLTKVIEHPRSFVRTDIYYGPCRRRRSTEEYHGPERRAPDLSFEGADDGRGVSQGA